MPTKRPEAAELFPVIYGELRRVAGRYLSRERRNHTLQPTALVHEAWLKLRHERGGGAQPVVLDDLLHAAATAAVPVEDLLTLEAALSKLEQEDARAAQV